MKGRIVLEKITEWLFLAGTAAAWCHFWTDVDNLRAEMLWNGCLKILLKFFKELWVFATMLSGISEKVGNTLFWLRMTAYEHIWCWKILKKYGAVKTVNLTSGRG